jgi:hypothetical protein
MISPSGEYSHSTTAMLDVPAGVAFAFMSDPIALGRWSLGCMNARPAADGNAHIGVSLFDGTQSHFAIDPDPERMIIDYRVGPQDRMLPRISARVVRPQVCGLPEDRCYLTLTAWRVSDMDAARWYLLCATHETEILLIKAQCEAAFAQSGSSPR